MTSLVPPPCEDMCPSGCDLACERPASWRPEPGVPFLPNMSPNGVQFVVDSTGGGVLYARAKGKGNTKVNRRVGSVRPWRGE